LKGKSYFNVISDHEGYLMSGDKAVTEESFMPNFTFSKLNFADGHSIRIWAPKRQLLGQLGLSYYARQGSGAPPAVSDEGELTPDAVRLKDYFPSQAYIRKGQLLARGILVTGDYVLVNKFAYHFRPPSRSEVFVFTTKNIRGLTTPSGQGAQHYIKRLAAVPGDTVEIVPSGRMHTFLDVESNKRTEDGGNLMLNGKLAEEPAFVRVMSLKDGYNGYGIIGSYGSETNNAISGRTLKEGEFAALGDNSMSSLDSRYWGPVPQRNIVGVGLFCFWPLLGPNFGPID
jgi:signal peptidase I